MRLCYLYMCPLGHFQPHLQTHGWVGHPQELVEPTVQKMTVLASEAAGGGFSVKVVDWSKTPGCLGGIR